MNVIQYGNSKVQPKDRQNKNKRDAPWGPRSIMALATMGIVAKNKTEDNSFRILGLREKFSALLISGLRRLTINTKVNERAITRARRKFPTNLSS